MKRKILTISTILTLAFSNYTFSQEKEVNFDKNYIKANNDKTTVEINEAQELIYIIISITDFGIKNSHMTNQETEYFQDVKKHFSKYSNLSVVNKFDKLLNDNIVNYIILSGNAYGFKFDGNKIVPTNVYNFPAKGIGKYEVKTNPIVTYLKDLEEFAKQSEYRKFYKNHRTYYNSLKDEYQNYATINEQKEWLESRFDYKINSYRVLTSPLISAINATHTFEDNNFKEMQLFLPTIRNDKKWSEKFRKAMNTRIIFTEIDHNYVGPVSAKYLDKINSIFNDRKKWVDEENKGIPHYPNPLKVYDEYLTWGLFILYSYDKFGNDKELFAEIVDNVNNVLVEKRGFIKAKEFNAELLNLYKKTNDKKIENIYQPLLEWSSKQ
jgi:hypothetical protein